mmetsp:Transcript_10156/g.26108  ORF Transcript_10156/g.26108 Transcript_10156/m.26108 type:complete len:235 (+) Transcript_10156:164-868(+)
MSGSQNLLRERLTSAASSLTSTFQPHSIRGRSTPAAAVASSRGACAEEDDAFVCCGCCPFCCCPMANLTCCAPLPMSRRTSQPGSNMAPLGTACHSEVARKDDCCPAPPSPPEASPTPGAAAEAAGAEARACRSSSMSSAFSVVPAQDTPAASKEDLSCPTLSICNRDASSVAAAAATGGAEGLHRAREPRRNDLNAPTLPPLSTCAKRDDNIDNRHHAMALGLRWHRALSRWA